MKTYLLDIVNRIGRFSESLDAKTIVCNKTWDVFNDNGVKETYIFQDNGNLIISNNGIVTDGKWEYIPANKSLIIRGNGQSYMLHPKFYNKTIFALQLDGTPECTIMIDEAKIETLVPELIESKQELIRYFEEIEKNESNNDSLQIEKNESNNDSLQIDNEDDINNKVDSVLLVIAMIILVLLIIVIIFS